MKVDGKEAEVIELNTAVVGTGAAGFNAAIRLKQFGVENIAIITEGVDMGTSRNTGSDKQTYYKLGMSSNDCDSPYDMASDLFAGQLTDGDNALCEAALSVRCFMNLCELGVEFPTNRYGEYVGYKTDHDPHARATSAGPLTSKRMTQVLEDKARSLGIPIYDQSLVVSIITDEKKKKACGLLALNLVEAKNRENPFTLFHCKNIVYATGGPAGMYADSVYPECQSGASGIAFEAGVKGKNLTEWQYGLASLHPRWNVSGTYMQVLPRFVSVDEKGNEHEFLADFFPDPYECLSMVFLKGYEWPFDCRKILEGSSIIDLLVYYEKAVKKRRIYLDFRKNPFGLSGLDYTKLDGAAFEYLEKAGACFGTPIERLLHMNAPAVELYRSKGVDIETEMLEISLCAQHNNGGLSVDMWWQTNVEGFFAAGEVAGTHGVYRPGGSALNAGQVGSFRAAQYISKNRTGAPSARDEFMELAKPVLDRNIILCENLRKNPENAAERLRYFRRLMSENGGAIRDAEKISFALEEVRRALSSFEDLVGAGDMAGLATAYRLRDTLISQYVYLSAMEYYIKNGGKSRGSYICCDPGGVLRAGVSEEFRFSSPQEGDTGNTIEEITCQDGTCTVEERPARAIPEAGGFFENVWRCYRRNQNIY